MNSRKDKQILVTGGTGFLGSYLLRYLLREGYTRIRVLRQVNSDMNLVADIADQIEWVEGDVLDIIGLEDAMYSVQQVYHCAAVVSFDPRDYDRVRQVNVDGTANVVNAALYANVEKLVYVSSIAAIGRSKNNNIVTEETKWERSHYNTEYAISKYLGENEIWRGMMEGLQVAIVNPGLLLGSGHWNKGTGNFFRLIWRKFPFYTDGVSGFVDVRDVARFMLLLMESDVAGERYILNAENLTFQTVLNEIAFHLKMPPPRIRITPFLQQLIWRFEWLRSKLFGAKPFITREIAKNAMHTFFYQNDKSITDFDFQYTPIRQTIAETCRQFREAATEDFKPKALPLV